LALLAACGKGKSAAENKLSGAIMTNANVTIGDCVQMTTHNVVPYSPEENAIWGYSVCGTSDPSMVKVTYDTYLNNYPVCVYPAIGGATYLVSGNCFSPTSAQGEFFIRFDANITDFNKILLVEAAYQVTFENMLNVGPSALPPYADVTFR
jgi:hypothetical protein